jgi:hypothetical protein
MPATVIAQLIIALGPPAFQVISDLVKLWNKPAMTVEEVQTFCALAQKSYDQYIAEAQARLNPSK